ncbi:hypothetical protein Nocox_09795 [Nonomuraea coxensis DSM 45129]|uniref:Uncharacterized protein n=1 Tax=Nonomuraea coxensis DSM 45129 TaxID=1122611 RepID=A0ABX8TXB7_9ACTN|nr:hypothetical protein [Nonomuraea coxensis]QYC39579.1 hypothetical protein Nocox_09795 [Nonomuraea coxensis DSM 45129]
MIRRVCAAAAVVTAVAGGAFLAVPAAVLAAAPAHADVWPGGWPYGWAWSGNGSANSGSSQSGNTFGDVAAANRGQGASTNVNNVNGIASTAAHGGIVVTYIFD